MVKDTFIHYHNLLTQEKFEIVSKISNSELTKTQGSQEAGKTICLDKTIKFNWDSYKGCWFSEAYEIDDFIPYWHPQFIYLVRQQQSKLQELLKRECKCWHLRLYIHNDGVEWHRHYPPKDVKLEDCYLCVYYLHPNWDTKYGGALKVGTDENNITHKFDCLSNSLVGHTSEYGHMVNDVVKGFKGDRMVFLTFWILGDHLA